MAFAVDPVLSNILFTLNLLPHLGKQPADSVFELPQTRTGLPAVSILLPLYREHPSAVERTVSSLESQTYPTDKMEIIYILEPDDQETRIPHLSRPIRTKEVRTDGKSRMKGHALNRGLEEAMGEIIAVYDADDTIDPDQVSKAVSLMEEKNYDVVQPVIIRRSGKPKITSFFELDNFIWNKRFLPFFRNTTGVFPLSGEGLYNRRKALDDVGGFPEVLAEDAYLSILLAEKGKKFGLLDSRVVEEPPKSWRGHFRQRVRWFRGYLTCLSRLLRSSLPYKKRLLLSTAFLAPLTCAMSLITWIFFAIYWTTWALNTSPVVAAWMNSPIYTSGLIYWGVALAYIGNVAVLFSMSRTIMDTEYEMRGVSVLLAPIYWIFLGLAAFASFFRGTRVFGRTERE